MAQDTSLKGGKSRPGGAKISPGGSCHSASLLPSPMTIFVQINTHLIIYNDTTGLHGSSNIIKGALIVDYFSGKARLTKKQVGKVKNQAVKNGTVFKALYSAFHSRL